MSLKLDVINKILTASDTRWKEFVVSNNREDITKCLLGAVNDNLAHGEKSVQARKLVTPLLNGDCDLEDLDVIIRLIRFHNPAIF